MNLRNVDLETIYCSWQHSILITNYLLSDSEVFIYGKISNRSLVAARPSKYTYIHHSYISFICHHWSYPQLHTSILQPHQIIHSYHPHASCSIHIHLFIFCYCVSSHLISIRFIYLFKKLYVPSYLFLDFRDWIISHYKQTCCTLL